MTFLWAFIVCLTGPHTGTYGVPGQTPNSGIYGVANGYECGIEITGDPGLYCNLYNDGN